MRTLARLAFTLAMPLGTLHAQSAQPAPNQPGSMHTDKAPIPPSHSLSVTYAGHVTSLSVDDLRKLPQTTVHVHNAHTNADETYSGPLVAEVLARAGLVASKETEPVILHSVVVATATDRFFALYSAAEVEPSFSRSQVIVALMKATAPDTEGGNLQLINTDGAKPARWVHGLLDLNVLTLTAKFTPPSQPRPAAPPPPAPAP